MAPQQNDYSEMRQIVQDAIEPLKEQLNRIYESLQNDFARKDRVERLEKDLEKLQEQVMSSGWSLFLKLASIASFLITAYTLVKLIFHI